MVGTLLSVSKHTKEITHTEALAPRPSTISEHTSLSSLPDFRTRWESHKMELRVVANASILFSQHHCRAGSGHGGRRAVGRGTVGGVRGVGRGRSVQVVNLGEVLREEQSHTRERGTGTA